ncbi:MAG: phosphatase PAP2 family protein [Acidovorax sp.]|nr:phosphatase PAP2 family protein [Acidovorax sp.]
MLPLDLALFHAINAGATTAPMVIAAARWVSLDLPLAVGGGLLIYATLGNAAQRRALAIALAAMVLAWIAVQCLRQYAPVPRPAQLGVGMQWLEHGARAGFPSMHAAAAFALATAVALARMHRLAMLLGIVAVAMAWSRVSLGVHFPSDVIAGAVTGAIAAWIVHAQSAFAAGLLSPQTQGVNRRRRFSAYWCRPARPWARRR